MKFHEQRDRGRTRGPGASVESLETKSPRLEKKNRERGRETEREGEREEILLNFTNRAPRKS